jgi:hypothetical protein
MLEDCGVRLAVELRQAEEFIYCPWDFASLLYDAQLIGRNVGPLSTRISFRRLTSRPLRLVAIHIKAYLW